MALVTCIACLRHPALEPILSPSLHSPHPQGWEALPPGGAARTDFEFTFSDIASSLVIKFYQLSTMESSHWLVALMVKGLNFLRTSRGGGCWGFLQAHIVPSPLLPLILLLVSHVKWLCPSLHAPTLGRAGIGRLFCYPDLGQTLVLGIVPCAQGGSCPSCALSCCFLSSVN